jgi:YidC/Oxa1 family membrane protein insertase
MDRRFFLALLLTMGVIVVTPRLFPGKPRPAAAIVAGDSAAASATSVTPAPAPATSPATIGATPTGTPPTSAVQAGTPAAAPAAAPVEVRTLRLTNALASYDFSTRGAAFVSAELPRYSALSIDSGVVRLADRLQPLVRYRLIAGGDTIPLDAMDFTAVVDSTGDRSRVTFTAPVGAGRAQITYILSPENYLADVTIEVTGVAAPTFLLTDLPAGFDTQERDSTDDRRHLAYAMRSPAGGAERIDFRKPDPGERLVRAGPFTWTVAKSKYFLVGLLAGDSANSPIAELQVTGAVRVNKVATRAQATAVSPIGPEGVRFELYAGPQEWERLVSMGREFEHVNPYGGWFSGVVQPFATIVMRILLWMKRTTALQYGWILVIFGVAIRLLMWPLNSRMMRSQMTMQRIAPAVQAAQNKHKGDALKQREAVMKVYQDAGISPFAPLAGCLPALIPMPILFALFFVFQNTIEFRGVPFLWFPDISVADPYYIAPFLTGGSMFLLSWLGMRNVPPNPQTKMMAWMMPVMMTVFGINFAAGLNLYWFVQNFAAMPQQWLISNERGKAAAATVPVVADGGERKRR